MATMVGRVRGSAAFRALARPDGRGSSGPIAVVFVRSIPSPPESPGRAMVAYAVGKRLGNAVRRNRLRRRLRAGVREVSGRSPSALRPGAYLVRADPGAAMLAYPELVRCVEEALTRASGRAGRPQRGSIR